MKPRISLAGRFAALLAALLVGVTGVAAFAAGRLEPWWLAWVAALLFALPLLVIGVQTIVAPRVRILRALADGAESLKDGDFSVSIADRTSDELGALVAAHNELGNTLREERQTLFQRELLLDTVIQTTDVALVLTNMNDRIVYSNAAARKLFNGGKPVNGFFFASMLERLPEAFSEAVDSKHGGLFTVDADEPQTYHLSHNEFTLNAQPHELYLFRHMTQELSRQEVATWKKVIRVISHELNNSLAPISSLAHSGRTLSAKAAGDERLDTIFATIEDRSSHLKNFIEGYARFARLPAPRPEAIDWNEFLDGVRNTVSFELDEPVPDIRCRVDPAQFEQVLINLLKNAHESGSPPEDIRMAIVQRPRETVFTIADRGGGISDEVMRNVLLPFYSTKKSGTGLGLPLCREIVEAHGGRLSLSNVGQSGLEVRLSLPA